MSDNAKFSALTRSSGAVAMLAIDQRESMREMFANTQREPGVGLSISASSFDIGRKSKLSCRWDGLGWQAVVRQIKPF